MKRIALPNNVFTMVDDEDFEDLNQFKWHLTRKYVARQEKINGRAKQIWMHRVVNSTPEGMETDHINKDTLDNRKSNLRSVTHQQNCIYRRVANTTGFRGVVRRRSGRDGVKWQAQITVNQKTKYLGLFDSARDAARTYNSAAQQYFGEFAKLNAISKY